MNREIKFRAWDGKEMCGNREALKMLWNQAQHDFYCSQPNDGKDYNGMIVWMQSVGLKDKNGKEIYEGDIVEYEGFHGSIEATMFETYEKKQSRTVDWMEKVAVLGHPNGHYITRKLNDLEDMTYVGNTLPSPCITEKEWEVIGNIFENAELLNP